MKKSVLIKRKNDKWFDFRVYVSKNIFLNVKHRMLSYLPCELGAEKSYIERKARMISFFSSI